MEPRVVATSEKVANSGKTRPRWEVSEAK